MSEELKPCPFCGSTDIEECDPGCGVHFIECHNCETRGPRSFYPEGPWNKRPAETTLTAQLSAAQKRGDAWSALGKAWEAPASSEQGEEVFKARQALRDLGEL